MLKTKRATLSRHLTSLIIGAAVAALLFLLALKILTVNYNEEIETQKSYLNTFNKQLQIADTGETGSFKFLDYGEKRKAYYLVYFGEDHVRRIGGGWDTNAEFVLTQSLQNAYCICYIDKTGGVCNANACGSSPLPIKKKGVVGIGQSGEDEIIISQYGRTQSIKITKENGAYIIEKA